MAVINLGGTMMMPTADYERKKPPCIRRQGMKRNRYSIVAISAC